MKVVVTGGAGFIGSNLAQELSKRYEVTVIDDLATGRESNLAGLDVKFARGSILDTDLLEQVFSDARYVFHQAALPSVQRSVDDPARTNLVNVNGTLNVLVAARDTGVKKVVFASSSSVYGDTPTLPKREAMIPDPKSPYAVTKLAGEHYCRVFSSLYGLPTVALRYFNVFGPRQDPTSQYAAVIPNFITRVLGGEPPVIHGDGRQTRDFTFVRDVVAANILAAESDAVGVFNIACQRRVDLLELADRIMGLVGTRHDPVHEDPRPGDVRDSLADISLASEAFGYAPHYSLTDGLKETIQWFTST
ncbi:MAG: SDR family oxidoreductase [Methanospirillum sp.]|nr:SDR family oxidoreductase [Methanospirillum sp.]